MRDARAGFFQAEAAGLQWLRDAGSARIPEILGVTDDILVTSWISPGRAGAEGAEELGRRLASLHARGAHTFGAEWAGYIGSLTLDNTKADDWPTFYVEHRIRPYLRLAVARGTPDTQRADAVQ